MNRYPGSKPFTRDHHQLFFGRTQDIIDFAEFIHVNRLAVLYSKSGLGKSSLLNAGVIPRLEYTQNYEALFIRFGAYAPNRTLSPIEALSQRLRYSKNTGKSIEENNSVTLEQAIENQSIRFIRNIENDEDSITLWQYLKERQLQEVAKNTPKNGTENGIDIVEAAFSAPPLLLVFDQFEELFTYPDIALTVFGNEFAELVNGTMPNIFRRKLLRLQKGENPLTDLEFAYLDAPLNLHIVLSLRSDRMSEINRLAPKIPSILRHTYELLPLSRAQAREAIVLPAALPITATTNYDTPPFEYTEDALEQILNHLSPSSQHPQVEAFQLQLICQHVEREIVAKGQKTQITPALLPNLTTIARDYYEKVINNLQAVQRLVTRVFIEDRLIDVATGVRISLDGALVRREGIAENTLQELITSHLIRAEPNTTGGLSYELSHDALVKPILDTRQERINEENIEAEKKQALEKLTEDQEKQRLQQIQERADAADRFARQRSIATIAAVLAIIATAYAFYSRALIYSQQQKLEIALHAYVRSNAITTGNEFAYFGDNYYDNGNQKDALDNYAIADSIFAKNDTASTHVKERIDICKKSPQQIGF